MIWRGATISIERKKLSNSPTSEIECRGAPEGTIGKLVSHLLNEGTYEKMASERAAIKNRPS